MAVPVIVILPPFPFCLPPRPILEKEVIHPMQFPRIKKKDIKRNLTWYSFIITTIVALCVLVYYPTLRTFVFSATDMGTYGTDYSFIGIQNYRTLLMSSAFLKSLKNTFLLAIYSLLTIPLGFLLANAVNSLGRTKTQSFFRVMYYLPNIITGVSVVLVFQYVLRGNGGLINQLLSWITDSRVRIGWITDPALSHIGATIIWIWMNLGYSMLLNLASLQSIPSEIYDAASVDGASGRQRMFHITIPQMKPCYAFLFVTGMINGLARFTDLYIIGGNASAGRPNGTLQTILMYIYQYSFESPRYGMSSAGAVILFVIVLVLTLFNVKMSGFMKGGD